MECNDPENKAVFIQKFIREFNMLRRQNISDFNTLYTIVSTLLLKYTWCVPSSFKDKLPDVSLYDHLKTTSAIAACLYQYHTSIGDFREECIKDRKAYRFWLVAGTFRGIQKYVFDLPSPGTGSVAKRLRARSFRVNVLLDVISHYICDVFNLTLNNIIISCGGKFYILLPEHGNTKAMMDNIFREVQEFLYEKYRGEIFINIVSSEIAYWDFINFDDVLHRINTKLESAKNHSFEGLLMKDNGWDEDRFILYKDISGKSLCRACRKTLTDADTEECENCKTDVYLGKLLANAEYIHYSRDSKTTEGSINIFKNYNISISSKENGYSNNKVDMEYCSHMQKDQKVYLVALLNDCNIKRHDMPYTIKYHANHIPRYDETLFEEDGEICEGFKEGQPLDIDSISLKASGKMMIGIFKADVDNMGFTFSEGLKRSKRTYSRNSISRISTLSRMTEMFFTSVLQEEIIHKHFPYTYCIFSGGDDLFLLGPWDSIIDIALLTNETFGKYTAGNPFLTISAGIIVRKPKYPVARAWEEVELQLETSKNIYNNVFYKNASNQVSIDGDTFIWEDFRSFIAEGRYLQSVLESETASRSQVARLINYSAMYRKLFEQQNGAMRVNMLRYLPLMSYDIARNYRIESEEQNDFRSWVVKLKDEINGNRKLYYLSFIARYALDKTWGRVQ